jgi:hypothetical protein
MTVAELVEALRALPPDLPVFRRANYYGDDTYLEDPQVSRGFALDEGGPAPWWIRARPERGTVEAVIL